MDGMTTGQNTVVSLAMTPWRVTEDRFLDSSNFNLLTFQQSPPPTHAHACPQWHELFFFFPQNSPRPLDYVLGMWCPFCNSASIHYTLCWNHRTSCDFYVWHAWEPFLVCHNTYKLATNKLGPQVRREERPGQLLVHTLVLPPPLRLFPLRLFSSGREKAIRLNGKQIGTWWMNWEMQTTSQETGEKWRAFLNSN